MDLYIKQAKLSTLDKFSICDEKNHELYTAKSELISIGKKLHIYDGSRKEVAVIHEKKLALRPAYEVTIGKETFGVVKKETGRGEEYMIKALGLTAKGDFPRHEYKISAGLRDRAVVRRKMLTWGEVYHINMVPGQDPVEALAIALVIDLEQGIKGGTTK